MRTLFKLFIRFYQKYISAYTPASCRYYPTCSEYAVWQFENNTFFKAFYFTITRILRCNQLFPGGIEYPLVKKVIKHNNIIYKKINIKYWLVPTNKNRYFVIKNRGVKRNNE